MFLLTPVLNYAMSNDVYEKIHVLEPVDTTMPILANVRKRSSTVIMFIRRALLVVPYTFKVFCSSCVFQVMLFLFSFSQVFLFDMSAAEWSFCISN